MITIVDKHNCCGCEACVQACPIQCISVIIDQEGFNYPSVNSNKCTSCGICEKVCPTIHPYAPSKVIRAYAAINENDMIRMQSSSGGLFTLIAEKILNEGGVVFGAKFDNDWNVEISYTETLKGLSEFRGSKYSQAKTGKSYIQCEEFLKSGRTVLYTGTPCQIAGLKHFLQEDYDGLLTCDIVCHGVPSPKIWYKYLREIAGEVKKTIKSISFRDKSEGWDNYQVIIQIQKDIIKTPYHQNPFMKAFLNDLILRPSCHECKAKAGKSHSDVTIGDFWGIESLHPDMYDNKGTSLLIINSEKGHKLLEDLNDIRIRETSLEDAISFNFAYFKSAIPNLRRDYFFKKLNSSNSVVNLISKSLQPSVYMRIRNIIKFVKAFPFIYFGEHRKE